MNRIGFVVLVLLLFGAHCFAIDFMGPPATELKSGQWKAGVIYSFSEQDIEVSGLDIDETVDDVEINRYYAAAAVGIWDGWELNGRIGAAKVEADVASIEFDGGTDFAWSWGTKITFASNEKIDWGALFQMSLLRGDKKDVDLSDWGLSSSSDVELSDAYEMLIAVGPTFKMEGWKLYGGPFLYLVKGDLEVKSTVSEESGTLDIEEDTMFGAYIGAQIEVAKNTCLNIEYALTVGGDWGVGAGIGWRF